MTNPPADGERISAVRSRPKLDTVPVLEETAVVEKNVVTSGRVRVTTRTTIAEEMASAILEGQEVDVERVAKGTIVSGDLPQMRTEGDVTVVPVFEEVLVVEKRLMLKEELHIRRRATVERVEVPVELRKQQADIERADE